MRVQVLYFAGCPNHKPAVDLARQVAAELGLAVEVQEVEVSSGDDVETLRFLGSPTIQVEGLDVDPAGRSRTDSGFSCRMYNGRGVPLRETVAQALAEAANGGELGAGGCCAEAVTDGVTDKAEAGPRTGLWAAGGSVVSAVASSACCWLPLLLAVFGFSAGGAAASFEKFRPLLLGLTAILLGTGFYLSYRRKPVCCAGAGCPAPSPGFRRVNRAILWMAAIAVVVSAAFPNYVGHLLGEGSGADASQDAGTLTLVIMPIEGMHCEGCATLVENALRKIPGVESVAVSYPESQASVSLDRNVLPADDPLVEAVKALGYRVPDASVGNIAHDLESQP